MKLLVLTQAVDTDDPVLGFMHRWIEEISKKYDHVEVVCLKEGKHDLPENVTVHSLGKEGGRSRIKYVMRFYRYIFSLRNNYDAVFVHMNQEYVLLGGLFWMLRHKPVVLWRNHKLGLFSTHLAVRLARTVCYTSPSAYIARFKNSVQMPIGIDTQKFSAPSTPAGDRSILFLGRIDGVKRPIEFLDALKALVAQSVDFHADIYGDPTYPDDPFFTTFKTAVAPLEAGGHVTVRHSVRNTDTPTVYGAHAVYVNLTPSGSFDKTIGEAMACGCIVVTANAALRGIIPAALITESSDGGVIAAAIKTALEYSGEERKEIVRTSRDYVEREHSLTLLVEKLRVLLEKDR
jgi:glycosyltransferase involved in cell wall biosynthesis